MLDFTQREKRYLPVKLFDGTVVSLNIPKKRLFEKLSAVKATLEKTSEIESEYDEIASITAEILSNNREGKEFTVAEVNALLDLEDMALIFTEYTKFASSITSDPN